MPVKLYRVFSRLEGAAPHENGGPLYVPPQGLGRIDNPPYYSVLYVSLAPETAVAEVFATLPYFEWTSRILRGTPKLPGSVRALAEYEVDDLRDVCDLDDPTELRKWRLRPSRVITGDRSVTQGWALRIYRAARRSRTAGVSWFSYHEGLWTSLGLWDRRHLRFVRDEALTLEHPGVRAAARMLKKQIRSGPTRLER